MDFSHFWEFHSQTRNRVLGKIPLSWRTTIVSVRGAESLYLRIFYTCFCHHSVLQRAQNYFSVTSFFSSDICGISSIEDSVLKVFWLLKKKKRIGLANFPGIQPSDTVKEFGNRKQTWMWWNWQIWGGRVSSRQDWQRKKDQMWEMNGEDLG